MSKIKFNNGVLKLDANIEHEKETAIFLAFSKANADHHQYDVVAKSLPRIKGLKRKKNRCRFAFDIVQQITLQGYEITKTEK